MSTAYELISVVDPARVILVETVAPEEKDQLAWILYGHDLKLSGKTLAGIVVTHRHDDHIRGVDVVAHNLGVPMLGPEDLGESIEGWRVLDTPGHADEHIALFDGRTLVAGDMCSLGDGDTGEFFETLDRAAHDLNPPCVLTAHMKPIYDFRRYVAWRSSGYDTEAP